VAELEHVAKEQQLEYTREQILDEIDLYLQMYKVYLDLIYIAGYGFIMVHISDDDIATFIYGKYHD
jgi:hypothetical protein